MISLRLAIQTAVVNFFKDIEFPIVTYSETGAPNDVTEPPSNDPDNPTHLKPLQPILCNEISSTFSEDLNYKRNRKDRRDSWLFELRMKFDREVLLEIVEDQWADEPLVIPANPQTGAPQVTLRLNTSEITHPVQQGGASGTSVKFTFEAEQGRK